MLLIDMLRVTVMREARHYDTKLKALGSAVNSTLLVAAGAFLLISCGSQPTVHYKISVSVDDNGTAHSGSSIWSFALSKGLLGSYVPKFIGEAVAVDIGSKGTLFALVVGRNDEGHPDPGTMEMLPERIFGDVGRVMRGQVKLHDNRVADLASLAGKVGARATLDCSTKGAAKDNCPLLVRFRDNADPKTIESVDPGSLAATFGPGVVLRRVTVTIVGKPGAPSIARRLPDYGTGSGFDQWYRNLAFDDPRRLTRNAFIAESK